MQGQSNKHIRTARLHRHLRNAPTDAELKLWRAMRARQLAGYKFRRQHPFGDYILDFVCLPAKLVVEVDGGQHADRVEADEQRTRLLVRSGFRVLRFWNNQVLNETEAVLERILEELGRGPLLHPLPGPPLEGEGDLPHPLPSPPQTHPLPGPPLEGEGGLPPAPAE